MKTASIHLYQFIFVKHRVYRVNVTLIDRKKEMCLKSYYIYVMHGFSGTKHITLYGQCCLLALCDMHVTLLGSGRWDKQYVRQV